ncbi:retrovirus-related Pol polyprotein from transposon 17.6, partial [Trichonephila clavipes]
MNKPFQGEFWFEKNFTFQRNERERLSCYREFSRAYIDDIHPKLGRTSSSSGYYFNETFRVKFHCESQKSVPLEKLKLNICHIIGSGFSGSTLYSPVPDKPYTIHSDASQIGIAACLSQKCGDKCYPIAYASQKLSKTQQSWSTIERGICDCVELKKFE